MLIGNAVCAVYVNALGVAYAVQRLEYLLEMQDTNEDKALSLSNS